MRVICFVIESIYIGNCGFCQLHVSTMWCWQIIQTRWRWFSTIYAIAFMWYFFLA